jgi:hypothetical protein
MSYSLRLGVVLWVFLLVSPAVHAAHLFEPLETEITQTAPEGKFFGFTGYKYETNGETEHELPIEIEYGLSERTQLNLEGEILILKKEGDDEERGVKEIGFGLKHLLWGDPDPHHAPSESLLEGLSLAAELEFAPVNRTSGDAQAFVFKLIASQVVTDKLVVHVNVGYELESRTVNGTRDEFNTALWRVAPMWELIHDRLYAVGELVGERDFTRDVTKISVIPELVVSPWPSVSFKAGMSVGLNDETADWGVRSGVSVLF